MNKQTESTKQAVLDQIKSGEIHMRPRRYFMTVSIVGAIIGVIVGVLTTYLSSIIFFWMRIQSASTPAYGARSNLQQAIDAFPWWLAIVLVVALAALVLFVKRFGALYRRKTGLLILVLLAVSLMFGLVLSNADMQQSNRAGNGTMQIQNNGKRQENRQNMK